MPSSGSGSAGGSSAGAGTPSAGNIQGMLHLSGYLGGDGDDQRRRKKRKLRKAGEDGFPEPLRHAAGHIAGDSITFSWLVSTGRGVTSTMPVLSPADIVELVKQRLARFQQAGPHARESDSTRAQRKYIGAHPDAILRQAYDLGDDAVRSEMRMMFAPDSHSQNSDPAWLNQNANPKGGSVIGDDGITLGTVPNSAVGRDSRLTRQDNKDQIDWADQIMASMEKIGARHSKADMLDIQDMHDRAVKLGASCNGHDNSKPRGRDEEPINKVAEHFKIAKVDESLGLVFGYGMICKINGEDYYDLNVDPDGNRVPEHIPEATMLKSAAEFMQNSRVGNEMHNGSDKGTYVFAMPWTTDIAKAFGVDDPKVTGLMIAYKPPQDVFAKFVDGTYTGFSIEGSRKKIEEIA